MLQSPTVVALLKSLETYLDQCREKFDYYEQQASECCGNTTYKSESRRISSCKNRISDGDAADAAEKMSGEQNFKVTVFFVNIDKLKTALRTRIEAYFVVLQRCGFGVLQNMMT